MICGNCGSRMKSNPSRPNEWHCTNCGSKKQAGAVKAQPSKTEIYFSHNHPVEKDRVSKTRPKTSVSRVQKRVAKAKRDTEFRQIARDLASRIGDMEIQFDRRIEELQAILVRLEQLIEVDES